MDVLSYKFKKKKILKKSLFSFSFNRISGEKPHECSVNIDTYLFYSVKFYKFIDIENFISSGTDLRQTIFAIQ